MPSSLVEGDKGVFLKSMHGACPECRSPVTYVVGSPQCPLRKFLVEAHLHQLFDPHIRLSRGWQRRVDGSCEVKEEDG